VAWGPGEPLSVEEVEVAPPGRLEVRVKVLFTSICHTDLGVWKAEVINTVISFIYYYIFACASRHDNPFFIFLHVHQDTIAHFLFLLSILFPSSERASL
jgi:hypothetical protein